MAALHLLEKGFNNLAYLGVDEATWSEQRRQGMEEVLKEQDRPGLLLFTVANSWQRRLHHLTGMSRWLKKLPLPCGIMAANDLLGYRVTLADVAAAFPLSRRALEKRFRHYRGKTLHQEITDTRLNLARRLLASGHSPAAASRGSGYRTLQHFYHAFKDRFGMTPLEFRKEKR